MKRVKRVVIFFLIGVFNLTVVYGQNFPFPDNRYKVVNENALLPEGKSIVKLNYDIKEFYDKWKSGGFTPWGSEAPGYLVNDPDTGFWYLAAPPTDPVGDTPTEWKEMVPALHPVTHSEGHGYAMMIVAIMAGYDKDARTIFDGMVRAYLAYRGTISVENNGVITKYKTSGMHWLLPNDLDNPNVTKAGSATDGDMDIAYALLLANAQWGNSGTIKYLDIAKELLGEDTGILKYIISERTNRVLSGNWMWSLTDGTWDGTMHNTRFNHTQSRPSDWMPDHLRAFNKVLPNVKWQLALDEIYRILPQIQSATGLFPDFIEDRPNLAGVMTPQPVHIHDVTNADGSVQRKYIEGPDDDKFFHNACRVPLRLAMDYLISGNQVSKAALQRFNSWSTSLDTNPDTWVSSTWHGYTLDGEKLDANNWQYTIDAAYYAPMIAAMIAGVPSGNTTNVRQYMAHAWDDMKNRWLGDHAVWEYNASTNKWGYKPGQNWSGYYGDTLALLSMLVISQNYWDPGQGVKPPPGVEPGPEPDAHDMTKIYYENDLVMYQNVIYRAKWYNQGSIPGEMWGPWEKYTVSVK